MLLHPLVRVGGNRLIPGARLLRQAFGVLTIVACAVASPSAVAQHKAHSHGAAALEITVEPGAIQIRLEVPLHDLVGFERAARSQAEQQRVEALSRRFEDAQSLLRIDPAAGCKAPRVQLHAPAIGLGAATAPTGNAAAAPGHADLVAEFLFDCERAAHARSVEIGLFEAFKGIRVVNARVASGQGQYRRALRAGKPRMDWGR